MSEVSLEQRILIQEIKGQEPAKQRLLRAIQASHLAHALLFSGPSGVGKREMAWAVAQALLCGRLPPCGKCYSCRSAAKKESMNVLLITPETLQIRLSEVQRVLPFLSLQTEARALAVIIDPADRLNKQAANSLLKIIEEPPPKSFFFLISAAPSKLPLTIRSRLQNIRFRPLSREVLKSLRPQAEGWAIAAAQGRLDLLEELMGGESQAGKTAFDLWEKVFERLLSQRDFKIHNMEIPKEMRIRKEALEMARIWRQLLRDARFLRAGDSESLIHLDKKILLEKAARLSAGQLDWALKKSLEWERDLSAGIDCALCLEQFVRSVQRAVWGRRA